MGSGASKQSARRKKGAPLPPPDSPKPLDPRLRLHPREKFFLQKSWKTVARNEETAAMAMFIKLPRSGNLHQRAKGSCGSENEFGFQGAFFRTGPQVPTLSFPASSALGGQ
ncbi:hypothetical protein Bbelb_245280 [Branchiostoma belcheri]|nr:hypothetical protein Bbelb_245280 [Branchiostoma belcheri]